MAIQRVGALSPDFAVEPTVPPPPKPEPFVISGRGHLASSSGPEVEVGREPMVARLMLPRASWVGSASLDVVNTRGAFMISEPTVLTPIPMFIPQGIQSSSGPRPQAEIRLVARQVITHRSEFGIRERVPYLALIKNLIEREQIPAARKMLAAIPVELREESTVKNLRAVLELPGVVKSDKRDIDRRRDYEWLRQRARTYRGQWVALDNGTLVAAARSLKELREQLRIVSLPRPPLLIKVE